MTDYKISIVMGYINRIKQLENTIKTIMKSKYKKYEIIIVDDGDEDITYLNEKYNIDIKIFKNPNKSLNPCSTYNYGFKQSSGDIVLIQNPECLHIGDLLFAINSILKPNNYIIFDCFLLNNYTNNDILNEIIINDKQNYWDDDTIKKYIKFTNKYYLNGYPEKHKGWVIHYKDNRNKINYPCAIFKKDLEKINYFNELYKDGICFDDNEFIRKIELNNINVEFMSKILESNNYSKMYGKNIFTIHQHHDRIKEYFNYKLEWEKNKNIFIREHKKYVNIYLNNYLNKNIFNKNVIKKNIDFIFEEKTNSYKIKNISNNTNFLKLITSININEINYTANVECISFKENINEIFNNCIFEFSCSITNNNKNNTLKILNNTDIINLNIKDNKINYTGKLYNILDGLTITNIEQKITITNPEIILKQINFINDGLFIIDGKTWKYKKIPKIASTYLYGTVTKLNYFSIKNFYDLNPEWILRIYVSKNDKENINNEYYELLKNIEDIEFIEINLNKFDTEIYKNEYLSYYVLSTTGGLWFNKDIFFINPIIDMDLNKYIISGNENIDTVISYNEDNTFSTKIMLSSQNNNLFIHLLKNIKNILFKNIEEIIENFNNLNIANIKSEIIYNSNSNISFTEKKIIDTLKKYNYYCIEPDINNLNYINSEEKYNHSDIIIKKIIKSYTIDNKDNYIEHNNIVEDDAHNNIDENNDIVENDENNDIDEDNRENEIKIFFDERLNIYIKNGNKLYRENTNLEECEFEQHNDFLLIIWNNTKTLVFYIKGEDNIYKYYNFEKFDMMYYKKKVKNNELYDWVECMKHWVINGYSNNIEYFDKARIIINKEEYDIYINHSHDHIQIIDNNKYYKYLTNKKIDNIIKINLNYFIYIDNVLYFNSDDHVFKNFIRIDNIYHEIDDTFI